MAGVIERMQAISAPLGSADRERIKVIRAGLGQTVRMIPVADLICFEATDKYVNVVTATGEALVRLSLRELISRIEGAEFTQVHRSVIVNSQMIDNANRDENGHYSLSLKGLKRPVGVSRAFGHLFRPMSPWRITARLTCRRRLANMVLYSAEQTVMTPLESRCRALNLPSLKDRVPEAEWLARVELAAAFRAFHDAGWDDLIFTHQSLRVPGSDNQFLINPFNLTFDEVTASSLVKIDTAGNVLGDRAAVSDVAQSNRKVESSAAIGDEVPIVINKAGFVIHSAIHMGHPKAHCVMHLHSIAGQAVACAEGGLMPMTQTSMIASYGGVAYHDFEGIAQDDNERDRLVADMGEHEVMILRNHGTLAIGETVGDAYFRMYYLERACAIQVAATAMSGQVNAHSSDALQNTWAQAASQQPWLRRTIGWPAVLRRMLRRHPDIDS